MMETPRTEATPTSVDCTVAASNSHESSSFVPVDPQGLKSLCALRDSDPALSSKWSSTLLSPPNSASVWTGVTFDADGCVTELQINGRRLKNLPNTNELSGFDKLTTVNLGNTDLPPDRLSRFLSSLLDGGGSLRRVYLGGNGLNGAALEKLASTLCRLEVIDLRYNDVGSHGASALAAAIKTARKDKRGCQMRILYLEGNRLGNDGCTALANALSMDKNLEEIYLGDNEIEHEGATALANALRENSKLVKLYLEGNRIGPEGAEAFSEILEERSKTVEGEEGKCLSNRCALKKLYVDNNGIGKEGTRRLAKALNSDTAIGDGFF